jgi:hypothetical protein
MANQTDRKREQDNPGNPSEGNFGQRSGQPSGTRRDADLQKEGNLGNERTRTNRDDEDDASSLGNRQNMNR